MAANAPQGLHDQRELLAPDRLRSRLVALAIVVCVGVAAAAGVFVIARSGGLTAESVGSTPGSATTSGEGEIRVTRDFGATVLVHRELPIPAGASAMSLLAANADVETAYGGGFVDAIDGLASGYTNGAGQMADWFYYVNGMQADKGAADYAVSGRDSVWWDYHRWDYAVALPAAVGQYPQPFLSGAGERLPTVIEHAPGFEPAARSIADSLEAAGVAQVSARPLDADAAPAKDAHVVFVGTWGDLTGSVYKDVAGRPATSGMYATFEGERLVTIDAAGGQRVYETGAGAVMATVNPANRAAAVWLVTGADAGDVERAAALLSGDGDAPQLQGRFGVAVLRDDAVVALPAGVER